MLALWASDLCQTRLRQRGSKLPSPAARDQLNKYEFMLL